MVDITQNNKRFFVDASFVKKKKYNSIWNERLPILLSILLFLLFCFFFQRSLLYKEYYSLAIAIFMIITSVFTFIEYMTRRNEFIQISQSGISFLIEGRNYDIEWDSISKVNSYTGYIIITLKDQREFKLKYMSFKESVLLKNTIAYILKDQFIEYEGEDISSYDKEVIDI